MTGEIARAADQAARESYGRLLARLAVRTRDIALAEDALAEAFATALQVWPQRGVPQTPEAWLLTVARRVLGHGARHGAVARAAEPTLQLMAGEMEETSTLPDDRLRLLFTCAHPAIDPGIRTPLMLQTVLGLDAERIGAAFLVAGPTMGQRLSRAKAKIRLARIPFETPEPEHLAQRLPPVLQAVYAAYGTGWDEAATGLAEEALFLARLCAELLPAEPEAKGLLALMLYCEARASARREGGVYVPLAEQDRTLWHAHMVIEAEALLTEAARGRRMGRFQAEAAIQSLHVQTARGAAPDPRPLALLYDLLVAHHPSVGALIGQALAQGARDGAAAGLALLDALDPVRVAGHQPYWAARRHLLAATGRATEAEAARARAMELSPDPAVRAWLSRQPP